MVAALCFVPADPAMEDDMLELLDLVPEGGGWSLYLGTFRIARNLSLLTALRVAGYRVHSAH